MSELKGRNLQEFLDRQIKEKKAIKEDLKSELDAVDNMISSITHAMMDIDDPHALIPRTFRTLEEWLNAPKHINPELTKKSHSFKNRMAAEIALSTTNTWQKSYHIVRI